MIYWSLRRDKLPCPGPAACPDAPEDEDGEPVRDERGNLVRCDACPVARLERDLEFSAAGRLIQTALELDAMRQEGIPLPPDLTFAEFMTLRILREERERKELENGAQATIHN